MDTNLKRKGGYATGAQTRRLIELLDADPELRSGKFSSSFTFKTAQKRWCDISDELNSIGGAHKTWNEWRKTYHDKKSKTKKKASAQNRSARQTGGGDPAEDLNDDEKLLLGSISTTQISGHSDSEESRVMFKDLTNTIPDRNVPVKVEKREKEKQFVDLMKIIDDDIIIQETNVEDNTPRFSMVGSSDIFQAKNISKPDLTKIIDDDIIIQETNVEDNTPRSSMVGCSKPGTSTATHKVRNQYVSSTQKRSSKLQKSLDAVSALQRSLQEKNIIKKEYYAKKIVLMTRQANALESIANSIATKVTQKVEHFRTLRLRKYQLSGQLDT